MKELCWVWKKTTKQQWCSYFQIAHKYWHAFMTDPFTSIVYIFHNGILSEVLWGTEEYVGFFERKSTFKKAY